MTTKGSMDVHKKHMFLRDFKDSQEEDLFNSFLTEDYPEVSDQVIKRFKLLSTIRKNQPLPFGLLDRISTKCGFKHGASYHWIMRFNLEGVDGLFNAHQLTRAGLDTGLPSNVLDRGHVISLAKQIIESHTPASLGYDPERFFWTLEFLKQALRDKHELDLSVSQLRSWLKKEGVDWKL